MKSNDLFETDRWLYMLYQKNLLAKTQIYLNLICVYYEFGIWHGKCDVSLNYNRIDSFCYGIYIKIKDRRFVIKFCMLLKILQWMCEDFSEVSWIMMVFLVVGHVFWSWLVFHCTITVSCLPPFAYIVPTFVYNNSTSQLFI